MHTPDASTLTVAHHEAGHLVAATLEGVFWHRVSIVPEGPYGGYALFQEDGPLLDPQVRAFIYWAGAYAQARYTNTDLDTVCADPSCSHDLAIFGPHRSPAHDRAWAAELDRAWSMIEDCAARLLLAGTIFPDQPDPLQDRQAITAFVASHQTPPQRGSDWSRRLAAVADPRSRHDH